MGQVQKQLDWYRISCCCCAVLTSIIFRSRRELRGTVSCVCKYVMYRVCFCLRELWVFMKNCM